MPDLRRAEPAVLPGHDDPMHSGEYGLWIYQPLSDLRRRGRCLLRGQHLRGRGLLPRLGGLPDLHRSAGRGGR